jgi:predicted MPP superfamily phosphohydrolase
MKVLAVGDLHTKSWIIDKVEALLPEYDAIVFCGDYADNWNRTPQDTMSTWRYLKAFMQENAGKVYAVIGNHDFAYIHQQIAGRSSGWNPVVYALINSPENKDLKEWLESLPAVFELDGVTFSHAGVTEQWNGEFDVWSLWDDKSPIWARPREYGGYVTYKEMPQVIGHNPSETIWNPAPHVWCIDTFSEHRDNTPIGDQTVLKIINGKKFTKVSLLA